MRSTHATSLLLFMLWGCATTLCAQDLHQDSLRNRATDKLQLSLVADAYYGYDFARTASGPRQPFYYSSNAHNSFAVNLAMLDAQYTASRVRGRIALGTGTYFDANYAPEPPGLRQLFEVSLGIKLARTHDLWLDAGVLPSPYGYEGAVSLDQMTYTRSFSAENSPYYVAGARLDLPLGSKWDLKLYVMNGWQNIVETNSTKALGTQLQYKPNDKVLLNWSTYIGDERSALGSTQAGSGFAPKPAASMRYFSDLYAYWAPTAKWQLLALWDVGWQGYDQAAIGYDGALWSTANAIARYSMHAHWAVAARAEYFDDARSVLITAPNAAQTGFSTYGGSINVDYSPAPNVRLRAEHRTLWAPNPVLLDAQQNPTQWSQAITLGLAARF